MIAKSQQARTQQAESGIQMLKKAMEYLEDDDSFNWNNLDVIFMEWDELTDEAHEIFWKDE